MAKKTILAIFLCAALLIGVAAPASAEKLDTSSWRADTFYREVWGDVGGIYPEYVYYYDGSIKGATAATCIDEVFFTYISLWDIFDSSQTPVYFEDFYTYTLTFKLSTEDGVAYFDELTQYVNELDIYIGSSELKYDMYGFNHPDEFNYLTTFANPFHATKGGPWVYLKDFFENVAVGTEYIDDTTIEIKIVFSSPARTLEHKWDMINVEVQDIYFEWDDSGDEDWIYFSNLEVQYDKDLSAYESAVQEGLTEIGGKVDDLNNTIQQGQQQAHQDANDIKDAINNQGQAEKNEAASGGNSNVAALQSSMGDFDLTTYGDAIDTLMASLTYEGTDTTWTLPSSGKVPFLNTTLWKEQEVDICPDYIVNLESFNLITVFTNFVVAIGCVYTVVRMFNDLLSTMNAGGSSGTGSKGGDDG